jgi:hypothetical protein
MEGLSFEKTKLSLPLKNPPTLTFFRTRRTGIEATEVVLIIV